MAPEVIKGEENLEGEIDYWSLGVVIFMVYTRKNPFDDDDIDGTIENILDNKIDWDLLSNKKIDPNLFDLLKQFLNYNHEERLKDFNIIKCHPYFKGNGFIFIY